jgi:hypothetical protein
MVLFNKIISILKYIYIYFIRIANMVLHYSVRRIGNYELHSGSKVRFSMNEFQSALLHYYNHHDFPTGRFPDSLTLAA